MSKYKRCIIILFSTLTIALILVILIKHNQRNKINELNLQQKDLEQQLIELQLEKEYNERMKEYMTSDEYILRYARKNLDYIGENEFKIIINKK